MNATHHLPRTVRDAACRDGRPSAAGTHPNLVIENLGELAAAGAPASSFCWADFAPATL